MPYTKSFKDYLTGSTIDLKSFHDLCGIPLIMNCDAGNKSYVDHVVNNIIDGSEPFQGDVSMNNNRIKNVHTTVSDYDTVNRFFCDVKYLKNTDGFNFLMKISNDRRQDAKDKTTTDLKTAQYDDGHNNEKVVKFDNSSPTAVSFSSSHFDVVNDYFVVKESGIYKVHFRGGYKGGAADFILKLTASGSGYIVRYNITTVEDAKCNWGQINIFFLQKVTRSNDSITLEISTGLLEGINEINETVSVIFIRKIG